MYGSQFISQAPKSFARAFFTLGSSSGKRLSRQVLFQHNFAHVRRIDRQPTIAVEINFGAAMLRAGDIVGPAETLEFARVRHPNAVDIPGRKSRGTSQPDVERIQVGAFTAEITGFEHGGNITDAASFDFGIAESVVDDPLVNRLGLIHVGLVPRGNLARCRPLRCHQSG